MTTSEKLVSSVNSRVEKKSARTKKSTGTMSWISMDHMSRRQLRYLFHSSAEM